MAHHVYEFTEGGRDMADLLGGKGANLAEMTRMGLPVPPGFTVSTEACRAFLTTGSEPDGLFREISRHLTALEQAAGRLLGQPDDPLLLSVRSGGRFSMPGMMETILDIGLNDDSVLGLAKSSGNERFAWDSYRRLVQMFGSTVMGVDSGLFEGILARLKDMRGAADDLHLDATDLAGLVEAYKDLIHHETGEDFPQLPAEQLRRAVLAVFESWNGERARLYRRREHIPDDLGTAVNVQTMVFGNLGPDSGSGVAFTRDPATGAPGVYGDYLANAQGEDVVAGIRNTIPLDGLKDLDPTSYAQLREHMRTLETHYRDLCDIEFTIERGRLWMLQTRVGKRTAEAAFAIAAALVDEGLITADECLARVGGDGLSRLMFPRFDTLKVGEALAHGIPASPGAAVGAAVFDSAEAVRRAAAGEKVVLVRQETTPDDLPGMIAAQAVLTSRGGKTSHAAVVARGMGKVCVCGAEELGVDTGARRFSADGTTVEEGTVISVDGSEGAVYLGAAPLVDSSVMRYFETGEHSAGLVEAVSRAMNRADGVRRLGVRANADTPEDAARARRFGAEGIGLCRTEHMFLGERRQLVEAMILARTDAERERALDGLLPLQREDFVGILEAMDGLPVTIRLLDPPLHEFLPDRTELAVRLAAAEAHGNPPSAHDSELLDAVNRMHEENPMLGLRGVRLGLVAPGLVAMQVRAIAEAVVERKRAGGDPRAEIMVPLIDTVEELRLVREEVEQVLAEVSNASGVPVQCPVGTMIELPRAALTAGAIAKEAEFFSFGTNDLTQTTWGFSRDDVEAAFFSAYLDKGIFKVSPFETIDRAGVGRLVEIAIAEGRAAHPGLKVGVCGEHGGDPESVHFFHTVGLDYVSCSPFRVPVARLEAGRAALHGPADNDDSK
ncbi:pyruvate, phosphate dikinase [Streptomyces phaeochromogenes]|uniref:Pyruvate, phosphate dikinase n=1 Tax=Streptomyces phaeochromogenes TaxID=1923 RepID=A0ABZ1HPL0_STRPH|nr:pyruvate, phosphate dikinase [Streptomyces phaeochromogenes]WSD20535.1 pyruvate, phosphate dikinase [Streptomyces phaeochromogenes]WSJ02775.1 pyruvate, phosphate dikinase [Streptomyces phaeochromogenes]